MSHNNPGQTGSVLPEDLLYMERAIELAAYGRFTTPPNPNVGCVIVKNGHIVGEGYHKKAGEAHAEVYALAAAAGAADGATAYVTLEPCSHYGRTPPCAEALIHAGIRRVVVAMEDPNPLVAGNGLAKLKEAGIEVICGVLTEQAEQLNKGFLKRMRLGRPWLQLKLAASLDGRTAMASGESKWITSASARQDVQQFRAQSSAILSTSATILADDPMLTVRWSQLPKNIQDIYPQQQLRQPLRVIIDSQNRLTPAHHLIQQESDILFVRRQTDHRHWPQYCQQLIMATDEPNISLEQLMTELATRQINNIWTEAGAKLAGALIQKNLVDELIIYLAPKLLGENAQALCLLPGLEKLADAPDFTLEEVMQIGNDLRLRLLPNSNKA